MSIDVLTLQRIISEFRALDREMQAQTMLAFLYIAERDARGQAMTISEVGQYLDLTSASATRNVQLLGERTRQGKVGHQLITVEINPDKQTEKLIRLSDKGRRLIGKLGGLVRAERMTEK